MCGAAALCVAGSIVLLPAQSAFAGGVPKTVTLTSSSDPSVSGQPVTFTATVSPSSGGGTLTFLESKGSSTHNYVATVCPSTILMRLSASSWGATCTASLPPGSHPMMASFTSVGNIRAAGFLVQHVETHVATTTAVTSSLNPSRNGVGVTFTATVTAAVPGTIQGSVEFRAARAPIAGCTGEPVFDNEATCTTSSLPMGPTTIKATFADSPSRAFDGSSATLEEQVKHFVNPPGHGGKKTVVVTSSEDPSPYGQPVTFTATVSPSRGGGTVEFLESGYGRRLFKHATGLCGASLARVNGNWVATCTATPVPGSHTVIAEFESVNGVRSSGFLGQATELVPTTTTVSSSLNPSEPGQDVTFTATVSPTNGQGSVAFKASGTLISGCNYTSLHLVGSSYQATCTTSSLPAGTTTVKAIFHPYGTDFARSIGTLKQSVS